MNSYTGSYMSGFMVLGALVILGSFSLLAYGRLAGRERAVRGAERALPRAGVS
jgi:hypothetical protein